MNSIILSYFQFLPEEGNIPDLTDEERKYWDSGYKDSNDNNDYHKMITLSDMLEVDLYFVCAKKNNLRRIRFEYFLLISYQHLYPYSMVSLYKS